MVLPSHTFLKEMFVCCLQKLPPVLPLIISSIHSIRLLSTPWNSSRKITSDFLWPHLTINSLFSSPWACQEKLKQLITPCSWIKFLLLASHILPSLFSPWIPPQLSLLNLPYLPDLYLTIHNPVLNYSGSWFHKIRNTHWIPSLQSRPVG